MLPPRGSSVRADLVLVLIQASSHSLHRPAAPLSQVFHLHLQVSQATTLWSREGAYLGSYGLRLPETPRAQEVFFLFVCLFLKSCFAERCVAGRMRNFVLLLCLWGVYCCFAAGGPASLGPEGPLQGNVHLFLLPPPNFFSVPGPLCLAYPSSVPSLSCEILPFSLRYPFAPSNQPCRSFVARRF